MLVEAFTYQEIVAANFTESEDFLKTVKRVETAMGEAFRTKFT
jgi:hypothetical protein